MASFKGKGQKPTHGHLCDKLSCVLPAGGIGSMDVLLTIRDAEFPHCPVVVGKAVCTHAGRTW